MRSWSRYESESVELLFIKDLDDSHVIDGAEERFKSKVTMQSRYPHLHCPSIAGAGCNYRKSEAMPFAFEEGSIVTHSTSGTFTPRESAFPTYG